MDKDKEIYNDKICKYCELNCSCDKNKFKVYILNDKVSMRCNDYKFKVK